MISEHLRTLKTALDGDKAALNEKKVVTQGNVKHSDVPDLIRQVNSGANLKIKGTEGLPSDATITARHTDGTTVTGKPPVTVDKVGEWTITDSWSDFEDKVTVTDTFGASQPYPSIVVTTDIGDGQVQKANCGDKIVSGVVSGGKVTLYLPKTGEWRIIYDGSEESVPVSVTERKQYTATYVKDTRLHFTLKLENCTSGYLQSYYYDYTYSFGNDFEVKVTGTETEIILDPKYKGANAVFTQTTEWSDEWDYHGDYPERTDTYIYGVRLTIPRENTTVTVDWNQNQRFSNGV